MLQQSHGIEMIPNVELKKLQNKKIIDISAGTGTSTRFLEKHCKQIDATEVRLEKFLPKHIPVSFLDVEDIDSLTQKVKGYNVLVSCGLFYHLQSHWKFLQCLCRSDLDYFFIETLCGPESKNPQMWWGLEDTVSHLNAYSGTLNQILHGTPNVVWINDAVTTLGYSITCLVRRFESWRTEIEPNCRWRMLIKIETGTKKALDISNELWKNKQGIWLT